jgi:signal transduction histidine kinase
MDPRDLLDPREPPQVQVDRLLEVAGALMRRVEQATDASGPAYRQFERAARLEAQVRDRTRDLEHALDLLNDANSRLAQAKAEADSARQMLGNAIQTVQEGFAIFDSADRLLLFNARYCVMLPDITPFLRPGLPYDRLVDLQSWSENLTLSDAQQRADWAIRHKARHAQSHAAYVVALTDRRWMQVSEHRTDDGGTVVLQTDVTRLIRAERQEQDRLLDGQARILRMTLDSIAQGVIIFDNEFRLVGWNEQAAELLAVPVQKFERGHHFDQLIRRVAGSMLFQSDMTPERLLGWVHSTTPRLPLRFDAQRPGGLVLDMLLQEMPDRGFVLSMSNVTAERSALAVLSRANETLEARVAERTLELRDAFGRAERANATRARFVAAASHDLLQPLSAAKLFLAAAKDESPESGTRETLCKAEAALESVETILGALLDLSRLELGSAKLALQPVPLGPILARLVAEFTPLAARRGLELRLRETQVQVMSEPTYLRRIVQNLIANAVRYTQKGGVIIGVRPCRPGHVRLDVIDTGPGIPPDRQTDIFREFHRLETRASAAEGLGLGLAIVERACAALDHRISLVSAPGKGARFSIELGLHSDALPVDPAGPTQIARAPGFAPMTCLLVVTNDEMRAALTAVLEGWGVGVLEASGGQDALDLLHEVDLTPDLALIDSAADTPEGGVDLALSLRQQMPGLSLHILTTDRGLGLQKRCATLGLDVIALPVDLLALQHRLREIAPPRGTALTDGG